MRGVDESVRSERSRLEPKDQVLEEMKRARKLRHVAKDQIGKGSKQKERTALEETIRKRRKAFESDSESDSDWSVDEEENMPAIKKSGKRAATPNILESRSLKTKEEIKSFKKALNDMKRGPARDDLIMTAAKNIMGNQALDWGEAAQALKDLVPLLQEAADVRNPLIDQLLDEEKAGVKAFADRSGQKFKWTKLKITILDFKK